MGMIRLRLAVPGGSDPVSVDAWPINSYGAEDLRLCVHRSVDDRGWTVSCRDTGLRLYTGPFERLTVNGAFADLNRLAAETGTTPGALLEARRRGWRKDAAHLLGGEEAATETPGQPRGPDHD